MTPKQQRFCDEYLIDLNATQAAIRAGYSSNTANEQGARLLAKVSVQNYIQERKQDRIERTEITQDMVLNELANIAFSNIADYVKVVEKEAVIDGKKIKYKTVDATLTDNLSEEQKKALSVIKEGKNGLEIKMNDKVRALELLGKHLGMWTEKVEVTGREENPFAGLSTEDLKKMIDDD